MNLEAFVSRTHTNAARMELRLKDSEKKDDQKGGFLGGFLKDLQGMAENLDDVVDDFVFKRMGAGEQWYGKRKYQPSGRFEEEYKGLGLTDKLKIDIARARKEEFLAEKERRRREAEGR